MVPPFCGATCRDFADSTVDVFRRENTRPNGTHLSDKKAKLEPGLHNSFPRANGDDPVLKRRPKASDASQVVRKEESWRNLQFHEHCRSSCVRWREWDTSSDLPTATKKILYFSGATWLRYDNFRRECECVRVFLIVHRILSLLGLLWTCTLFRLCWTLNCLELFL